MEFLRMLESVRNPFLTVFFRICTFFGDEILIFAVICCLFWCVNKNLAYRIGLAFLISGLLVQELKIIFRVERPWILDPSLNTVKEALESATGYSFPSGHTQSSTALFGSLALYCRDMRLRIICTVLFLLVGLSRMYLGVHTPADVTVSMALTLTVVVLVYLFMRRFDGIAAMDTAAVVIMIAVSIAAMLHSMILIETNIIHRACVSDICKASAVGLGFALGWKIERTHIRFDERKGRFWQQVMKLLIGLSVILIIKEGMKLLLGEAIWADIIRYFLLSVWALVVYPYIIKIWTDRNMTASKPVL